MSSPSSSLVHQHQEEVSVDSLQLRLTHGAASPHFIGEGWSLERLEECEALRDEAWCDEAGCGSEVSKYAVVVRLE